MQKKSQGVSFILTLIFGPVGIFYSSVTTAFVILVAYIFAMFMAISIDSLGILFLAVIGTIITGAFSVTAYNENLEAEEKKQKEMQKEIQDEMIKKAIEDSKQKDFIQELMIEKAVQARLKEINKNDLSEPFEPWVDDGLPKQNEMRN